MQDRQQMARPTETSAEAITTQKKRSPSNSLQALEDFMSTVDSTAYEPIPTGFSDIDKALGGGFILHTLVSLGAAPGAGKTIFAQQVFERIASTGRADVLYFSLEMATEQMIARSISRDTKMQVLDVLRGYQQTDEQVKAVSAAYERYKRDIAPFIAYNPPTDDGVSGSPYYQDIVNIMRSEAEAREDGRPLLCVVDYLQLLQSKDPNDDAVDIIKKALLSFKTFATTHNALIFCIIAHSRASNEDGNASLGAGRDTSAIEYSGDVQLSLNYTDVVNGNYKTLKDLLNAVKNGGDQSVFDKRSLVITKNRFGRANARVDLIFRGEESRFVLVEKRYPFDVIPPTTSKPSFRL